MNAPTFRRRLDQIQTDTDTLVCVGLDPRPELTRLTDLVDACRRVIDATIDHAAAYKPNSAFYEAHGPAGLEALLEVIETVPDDRVVLLDAKRGDIGSTAEAYARAVFQVYGVDAVTVSPYLGEDSLAPFLADASRGVFVLCHTSNPGAQDLQTLSVNGQPLYSHVARLARHWNTAGNVGLVVGATYPEALALARDLAPGLPILVPGVGAQGGDLEGAVTAGVDRNRRGLLVSSSRGIFYADDPRQAAADLKDRINRAREAVESQGGRAATPPEGEAN